MGKEIRVKFSENELDLYKFLQEKKNSSGFLKNLAALEKKREENYIKTVTDSTEIQMQNIIQSALQDIYEQNNKLNYNTLDFMEKAINKLGNIQINVQTNTNDINEHTEKKLEEKEDPLDDFDLDDLDISDIIIEKKN